MAFPNVGQMPASTGVGLPRKPSPRMGNTKGPAVKRKPQMAREALVEGLKGC